MLNKVQCGNPRKNFNQSKTVRYKLKTKNKKPKTKKNKNKNKQHTKSAFIKSH